MESTEKKKETSNFDENELEQVIIHLKQMIEDDVHDDDEGNGMGETVTHLTGKVRSILQAE